MYAELGMAYACAVWLQALQYIEEEFCMKMPLPNQTVHVSTLTFQTPLLVQDTTDNENKREK